MTTPYRDDTDSLEARHTALAEELSSVQARTKELDELRASEARLAKEVADVQRKLEGRRSRRALPLLESIQIASPCTAKWDEMVGDERARFCGHCQKDVFNLSAMPRDEAEAFMRERTSDVCVRLYRRFDGTVLTSDCPVGVKRKRRRKAVVAAVGGGLLAAGAFLRTANAPIAPPVEAMGTMTATPSMGAWAPNVDPPPAPEPVAAPTHEHIISKRAMPTPPSRPTTLKPAAPPTSKPGVSR
ncbi:MAG: hypothetical protein ABJE95_39630 [Byssovorax sp.]